MIRFHNPETAHKLFKDNLKCKEDWKEQHLKELGGKVECRKPHIYSYIWNVHLNDSFMSLKMSVFEIKGEYRPPPTSQPW